MAEVRIELLGGFRVTWEGRAIPEEVWRRRKTAALFKLPELRRTVRRIEKHLGLNESGG